MKIDNFFVINSARHFISAPKPKLERETSFSLFVFIVGKEKSATKLLRMNRNQRQSLLVFHLRIHSMLVADNERLFDEQHKVSINFNEILEDRNASWASDDTAQLWRLPKSQFHVNEKCSRANEACFK